MESPCQSFSIRTNWHHLVTHLFMFILYSSSRSGACTVQPHICNSAVYATQSFTVMRAFSSRWAINTTRRSRYSQQGPRHSLYLSHHQSIKLILHLVPLGQYSSVLVLTFFYYIHPSSKVIYGLTRDHTFFLVLRRLTLYAI